MVLLSEVLDVFKLADEVAAGNISERVHPEFSDLFIYNYTPQAAYAGNWTHEQLVCRGLIVNRETDEVLARPLKKFFNLGQTGAPEIALSQEVRAANKYDGSLGIIYRAPNGELAVATRGSFQSEQAIHATEVLRSAYSHEEYLSYEVDIEDGYTPLVEIIYPQNRIVLNYGERDYLQRLGWVFNESGAFAPSYAERLSFGELLARPPRSNAEGYVVWLDQHTAVKIKQEDYVELHAIVTGLNEKRVWRAVQNGPVEFDAFVGNLPDELQAWAKQVGHKLNVEFGDWVHEIDVWYQLASEAAYGYSTGDLIDRKEFANAVHDTVPPKYRSFMFSVVDGKDYATKIWKLIEPKGNTGFRKVDEEV